jgi:hypothetical protein
MSTATQPSLPGSHMMTTTKAMIPYANWVRPELVTMSMRSRRSGTPSDTRMTPATRMALTARLARSATTTGRPTCRMSATAPWSSSTAKEPPDTS